MNDKTLKVRIQFDPECWPKSTYGGRGTEYHLWYEQPTPPPPALRDVAIPALMKIKRRVEPFQKWWRDLSEFDPSLKGWKLVGNGNMPTSILIPGERPAKSDLKLAMALAALSGPDPDDKFNDVDPHPGSLDLP